jgi:hypothetical protein
MTVTVDRSIAPKLAPRIEVGVNILKLPDRAVVEATCGSSSEEVVMAAAAKLAGPGKKTDIVVFHHRPWHRVGGKLLPHPEAHTIDPETILRISFHLKERPVWWSTEPFTILDIRPSGHHGAVAPGTPINPFQATAFPYRAEEEPTLGTMLYTVRATPIVSEAVGTTYKITFNIGEDIDPDMEGTP